MNSFLRSVERLRLEEHEAALKRVRRLTALRDERTPRGHREPPEPRVGSMTISAWLEIRQGIREGRTHAELAEQFRCSSRTILRMTKRSPPPQFRARP